jgi:hypothetical protein
MYSLLAKQHSASVGAFFSRRGFGERRDNREIINTSAFSAGNQNQLLPEPLLTRKSAVFHLEF